MTLISNTGSSVAAEAQHDLRITKEYGLICFTTLYLIGQAAGGIFLPPVSEAFGGRSIYVASTLGFAVCCMAIAAVPTLPVVVLCRILSGFLSAMPATVAVGSLENMFDSRARIWAIHLWIAGAVVGLAVGPVFATYIGTSRLRW